MSRRKRTKKMCRHPRHLHLWEKSSWGVDEDSQPLEVVTAETALDPVSPSTAKTVKESMLVVIPA